MRLIFLLFIIGCNTSRPLMDAANNPDIRKINTKTIIKGDSNIVEINYYVILPQDSLKN